MPRSHLATRGASPPHATRTRRRCCLTARCWWHGDMIAVSVLPPARNCTTQPAGPGVPRATSTPDAPHTRRRGCPTARCWLAGGQGNNAALSSAELYDPASGTWSFTTGSLTTARSLHSETLLPDGKVLVAGEQIPVSIRSPARNCTTLPAGRGVPLAASASRANGTRRRCCPTARYWWQGEITAAPFLTARNCTTRLAGCGLPRVVSPPHARHPRRRCCPTARCWWQGD